MRVAPIMERLSLQRNKEEVMNVIFQRVVEKHEGAPL